MPAILARAIGIDPEQMPRDAEMARLFEAGAPTTARPGRGTRASSRGFDLVFSPHKSVSLAAEFAATPSESAALWNAVDRAADRAMRYVAQVLGWARKGAGGEDGADPGAVGWISFRHHTARPTLANAGRVRRADLPVRCAGRRRSAYARPPFPDEPGRHGGRPRRVARHTGVLPTRG